MELKGHTHSLDIILFKNTRRERGSDGSVGLIGRLGLNQNIEKSHFI